MRALASFAGENVEVSPEGLVLLVRRKRLSGDVQPCYRRPEDARMLGCDGRPFSLPGRVSPSSVGTFELR